LTKLDKTAYERISVLVREGKYPSIESFVEVAVRNQLLLETDDKVSVGLPSIQESVKTSGQSLAVPTRLPRTVESPHLSDAAKSTPLWGQVNRFAPMKFVLRILLNSLVSSDDDSVDLKRLSAEAAEKASEFRIYAKKKDKKKRIRGEFLHIGFPKRDPRSQQRFLNYYVGKGPFQRWTDNITVGLSLANIVEAEDGSRIVGLTKEGLRFAQLTSPLIDDFFVKGTQIDDALSHDEAALLIDQIKSFRPGEYDFMNYGLAIIRQGTNTPVRLRDKISEFLKDKNLEIQQSEKVTNTMQVGLIGRLVELRLLNIVKDAQRSKYVLTEKAEDLIGKLG